MGCGRLGGWIGPLDDFFAYETARSVSIRDWRLGVSFLFVKLLIFTYAIVYQVIITQQYLEVGAVYGSVRLQLQEPVAAFRAPDGSAPYCAGANTSAFGGARVLSRGWYAPDGALGDIASPQGICQYADAATLVRGPGEQGAVFLPTRTTVTAQIVQPNVTDCALFEHSYCRFAGGANASLLTYVADAEMFTILVDHNFASEVGISRSAQAMSGRMLDLRGALVDPCDAYRARGFRCPPYVAVGGDGTRDIVPIATLMQAAGLGSLDVLGGDSGGIANETLRFSGVVLLVSVSYTNFFVGTDTAPGTSSFNASRVEYTYTVAAVPNAEYKALEAHESGADIFAPNRTLYNRHGVRVVVTQRGRVGRFDVQALLINLTVALGLLAAASAVIDFVAFSCHPMRAMYARYQGRETIEISQLSSSGEDIKALMGRFKADPYLIDPMPPILAQIADATAARREARKSMLDGMRGAAAASPAASTRALPTGGGGGGDGGVVNPVVAASAATAPFAMAAASTAAARAAASARAS